ncbi:hypothetical protein RNJ44_04403 [Nakaseomyces bracarensis]|uniref:Uncharacterized protein n=1 Tax=Nakaseomyces bracarensis TaxID=273131 RepID=A0ABR4NV33_9SACH
MDSVIKRIRDNQDLEFKVANRKIYLHVPSFVLGCLFIGTLGSLLKNIVGGLLVSIILVSKFVVILGGILCCLWVVTGNKRTNNKPQESTHHTKNEDIGTYKYFDIPVEKEDIHRRSVSTNISIDETDLYNNFVRKAKK